MPNLCRFLPPFWLLRFALLVCVGLGGVSACRAGQGNDPVSLPRRKTTPSHVVKVIPALTAQAFGTAPAGTFGPYLGSSNETSIAIWAQEDDAGRHWYSVPVRGEAAEGGEFPAPRRLGEAPTDVGLVAIRAIKTHTGRERFLGIASSGSGDSTRLDSFAVGESGELQGDPAPLALDLGELVWLEIIETPRSHIALWALREKHAVTIYSQPLGDEGQPEASATAVLHGALSWQVSSLGEGAALGAVVRTAEAPSTENPTGGDVRLLLLDPEGQKDSDVALTTTGTADTDLDMVRVGDTVLVAWSDRVEVQAKVSLAQVRADGKVLHPAHAPIPAQGDQAVVKLVSAKRDRGAYLALEEISDADADAEDRKIRVVFLNESAQLGRRGGEIEFLGAGAPELVATTRGLGILTLAQPCQTEVDPEHCEAPPVASFVELDKDFKVLAAEPLRLDLLEGDYAPLAWGLTCDAKGCFALAAEATAPAKMWVVDLSHRSNAWEPAAYAYEIPPPPRMRSTTTIAATEPLTDVALAKLKAVHLVAWLPYFDPNTPYTVPDKPAPDGKLKPVQAVLQVQRLEDGPNAAPEVVSYRARSLGGLALATEGSEGDRALLVWSALDGGKPQVFTTLLDNRGKKVTQKMLTQSGGEVNDVAAIHVGDGWIVAWVDERLGYPEVFVAKLDSKLQRVGSETRISQSPGSATGVTLLALEDTVLIARSDARGHETGQGEIYLAEVSKKDGSLVEEELRLTSNKTHSRSPALARIGDRIAVAWLETSPVETSGAFTGSVNLGLYAPDLRQMESTATLAGEAGVAPTSVSMECDSKECRVLLLVETAGNSEFHGFVWAPKESPEIVRVLRLAGKPTDVIAPRISGDVVVFADATRTGKGRVRKGIIDWK